MQLKCVNFIEMMTEYCHQNTVIRILSSDFFIYIYNNYVKSGALK